MWSMARLFTVLIALLAIACSESSDGRPAILATVDCDLVAEAETLPPLDDWDYLIQGYESYDRENPSEKGAILFTGSSSTLFWSTLSEDMDPLFVINRGFGGSVIVQATNYVPRILLPYEPRAVVIYSGDNDMARGRSADCVLRDLEDFVGTIQEAQPGTPVYVLAIKPSFAREALWPDMQRANALFAALGEVDPNLAYIDVATAMFDDGGELRPELFVSDGLHLSPEGYALWTSIVRPVLLENHS